MATIELPRLCIDDVTLSAPSRLLLANRDPSPGEEGVPLDALIALELIDIGPTGVDRHATRVWVDDVLAFEGSAASEISPTFAGPAAAVVQSGDTLRIVLDSVAPFRSLAAVRVRTVSRTVGGAATLDETYVFTIEDRTAPRLVAAQAMSAREIRVSFDEPVLLPMEAHLEFTPRAAPAVNLVVVDMSVEANVVRARLEPEMTPDILYEVRAIGVTDRSGNVVLAPYDRALFAGYRPARPSARRFDLWGMLPKHNRRDDQTGDLRRFISCLQEVTDLLLADLDRWSDIFHIERAPPPFLDLVLKDLGSPFAFELDVAGKRRLATILVEMYRQKGTGPGVQNAIRFFLGLEILVTAFNSDGLVLGESELGVDWILGPSSRFALYAFNVEVGRVLAPRERKYVRTLIEYMKPAHTHLVDIVEPSAPIVPSHWELGLSSLDETTLLH